jgi:hypothetical protein
MSIKQVLISQKMKKDAQLARLSSGSTESFTNAAATFLKIN